MDTLNINEDIHIYMVKATSFPDDVLAVHNRLHKIAPEATGRQYYGISYPGMDGKINYWAAANELYKGELAEKGMEHFVIIKGTYLFREIDNYMQNVSAIGRAFQEILTDSRIAHDGCCIEQYTGTRDCRCMVRIKS